MVLLVDDDHNDMALFALAVEQTDTPIWVQTALGIQEAMAYLQGTSKYSDRNLHPEPQLILLDLKMDSGDGFDFLQWRRQSGRFLAIPVVIFTGNQNQADLERAVSLGATTHIEKPMSFQELKATVRQIWRYGREMAASVQSRQATA